MGCLLSGAPRSSARLRGVATRRDLWANRAMHWEAGPGTTREAVRFVREHARITRESEMRAGQTRHEVGTAVFDDVITDLRYRRGPFADACGMLGAFTAFHVCLEAWGCAAS